MMAELTVTKKEIGPQRKKSTGTMRAGRKSPAWVATIAVSGKAWGWAFDSLAPWFGALLAAWFAASAWTPVEGKIGADTAARTRVI
jgi:hypothetical protein